MEDVIYCWGLLLNTLYGDDRKLLERAIGETLKMDRELGKRYILVGGPGTGKSTIIHLLQHMFETDNSVCFYDDIDLVKVNSTPWEIAFACTNREPSSLLLEENDIVIHTTGERMYKTIYSAIMALLTERYSDIVRICLDRVYSEDLK